jgi:hypothetical protein
MNAKPFGITIVILLCTSMLYAWRGDTWGLISRQTILSNAATMIDSTWSPHSTITNYDGSVGRNFYAGTTYRGELYSNSSLQNWAEFFAAVNNTSGGNTYYGNNCAGFVNVSWQLPAFYPINAIDSNLGGSYFYALGEAGDAQFLSLLPGDAFYRSGHIFLFSQYNPDGTIESMEQVVPNARRRIWSWSALQPFRPIRRNLVVGGFDLNSRVQTSSDAIVRSCPSFSCGPVWTAPIASQGTIVQGPTTAEKYRWWQVKYDDYGTAGWTTEGYLRRLPDSTSSCTSSNTASPNGTIAINSGASYANARAVMLTLACSSAGSGCAWMRFSNNSAWSPWEPFSKSKSWILPAGDGPKTVGVQFADACGNVSVPSAVPIALQTPTPDLTVSSLVASGGAARAGGTVNITDTASNIGSGGANASTTTFFFSATSTLNAGATVIGSRFVPVVGPGKSHTGTTSVSIPNGLSPGIFYIIARANSVAAVDDCGYITPCGSMIETSRGNNTRQLKISIGPDLVISSLNASTTGSVANITDTTRNSGGDLAGSSRTSFYLSANTTFDSGDILLGSRSVPALAAGAISTATSSVTIPAGTSPGTYYIIAEANHSNVVVEANYNNNTKNKSVSITPQ